MAIRPFFFIFCVRKGLKKADDDEEKTKKGYADTSVRMFNKFGHLCMLHQICVCQKITLYNIFTFNMKLPKYQYMYTVNYMKLIHNKLVKIFQFSEKFALYFTSTFTKITSSFYHGI